MNPWIHRLAFVVVVAIAVGLAIARNTRADPGCAGISAYNLAVYRSMQPFRHVLDAVDFQRHTASSWTQDEWRVIEVAADDSLAEMQKLTPPPGVAMWHAASMESLLAMSTAGHDAAAHGAGALSAHAGEIQATARAMVTSEQSAMKACPNFTRGTSP